MLNTLYVKDIALIHELRVSFDRGLNIITGETGAGKSILIGALGALLGEKLDRSFIRTGARKGIVEGVFRISPFPEMTEFFHQKDLEWFEDELYIRREMLSTGRSRCFVNDTPVSVSDLNTIGEMLVDLHGQHDHQLLLKVPRHIQYLDAFSQNQKWLELTHQAFKKFLSISKKLAEFSNRQQELIKSKELLEYQYKEIKSVDPQSQEDDQLKDEEKILGNAEVLFEHSNKIYQRLYEQDGAVTEILANVCNDLQRLVDIDKKFEEMSKECENVKIIINDLALSIQQYATNITFDAGRLEEIRRRMVSINSLKKKYGGTIDAIRLHKEKLEEELGLIENYDEQIDELKSELEQCRKKLLNISLDLSDSRKKSAQKLCEQVTERLKKLGMPKAKFDVSFRYNETSKEPMVPLQGRTVAVNADGIDQIEFLVTTNVGESPKPLVKVASGGEISRIMLALKSLLAESDRVPVLIFDEIDMGISGRIAQSVGTNLRELANSHQTICITHLPQIASLAQHHYLVEKISDEKETHIQIRKLNTDERVEQIARLFGGEIVTETHLQSAKELINAGENN